MNATTGTLRITTTGTARVQLTSVDVATTTPNRPPVLAIAFTPISIENTTTVNLSDHFLDPDGDPLYYTVGSSDLVNASVTGTMLSLTPAAAGNGTLTVYASDLHDLVPSSIALAVQLPPVEAIPTATTPSNAPNASDEAVVNTTIADNSETTLAPNSTAGAPENATASNTTGLDCTNTNPNLRPLECLQAQADRYFTEPDKYWENNNRDRVARINALGNLVIKGTIHQGTSTVPSPGDFVLGTTDENGALVPTIWVSTSTGDLYLRGRLHEEVINMNPTPGMYSIVTRRSIYLLLADTNNGDLYLRGDLIAGREVNE
jgi:hypothetical protein